MKNDTKHALSGGIPNIGRPAHAILSNDKLLENIKHIKEASGGVKTVAMIKANAYGHGIRQVARRLENKVDMLGVVSTDEALIVRSIGVQTPVLLMEGPLYEEEIMLCKTHDITMVIHHGLQLEWLMQHKEGPLSVWIMLDTGMGHLGFHVKELPEILEKIESCKHITSMVIASHFACADEKEHHLNTTQIEAIEGLRRSYGHLPFSMCNSAGLVSFPQCHYDYVRPGIGLYTGISKKSDGSEEVMTLKSKIIAIKQLEVGDSIGYGAVYVCDKPKRVGIIACGYGDGYPLTERKLPVLIKGRVFYTLGKTSMDRLVVDLEQGGADIRNADDVTLWGEGLPVGQIAQRVGRSRYEILTGIANRVRFYWV